MNDIKQLNEAYQDIRLNPKQHVKESIRKPDYMSDRAFKALETLVSQFAIKSAVEKFAFIEKYGKILYDIGLDDGREKEMNSARQNMTGDSGRMHGMGGMGGM